MNVLFRLCSTFRLSLTNGRKHDRLLCRGERQILDDLHLFDDGTDLSLGHHTTEPEQAQQIDQTQHPYLVLLTIPHRPLIVAQQLGFAGSETRLKFLVHTGGHSDR